MTHGACVVHIQLLQVMYRIHTLFLYLVRPSDEERTTLAFGREYLGNGSRYRQSENGVINDDPPRSRKSELWSTNKEVLDAHFAPP